MCEGSALRLGGWQMAWKSELHPTELCHFPQMGSHPHDVPRILPV